MAEATGTDVVERFAKTAGVTKKSAAKYFKLFLHVIKYLVTHEEELLIPGFGSFWTSELPARKGRNPKTGKSIKLPATKVIRFSSGSDFKNCVKTGKVSAKPKK